MKRMFTVVILVIAAVLLLSSLASAQEEEAALTAGTLTGGDISVTAATPLTATLQLQINGEIVNIIVPGLLTIDAEATIDAGALAAASVMPGRRIGGLTWEIESIEPIGDTVERQYGDPLVSETGEFVVVTARATNIGQTEFSFSWDSDVQAIDEDSLIYERHDYSSSYVESCDSINPGLTVRCQYLFEVPSGAEIVGMNVSAKETGTIFALQE